MKNFLILQTRVKAAAASAADLAPASLGRLPAGCSPRRQGGRRDKLMLLEINSVYFVNRHPLCLGLLILLERQRTFSTESIKELHQL
ncbi:unnamed protein product [Caretta caretta]